MSHRLARLLCFALCAALPTLSAKEEATPVPTEITSKHFESRSTDTEMTTLFTGDVVVTGTNLRITCDRIEVVSMRLGEKTDVVAEKNRFKSLVATGSVKIIQADREATCGRAVVLPGDDKITLTETPVVIDHGAGLRSIFYGLTALDVEAGDDVKQGQLLGTSGRTVVAELRIGTVPINPLLVWRGQCDGLKYF
jgi:murein DD-endopeptidase MepM/ murein hydrolase activator NlpD